MFIDNMSYDEIMAEWCRDWGYIFKKLVYLMPKLRRKAIKSKDKIRHTFEYTTPSHNFYFITFVFGKDFVRHPLRGNYQMADCVCIREGRKGKEAMSFIITDMDVMYDFRKEYDPLDCTTSICVEHYTAHFFARFAERYGCDKKGIDLIKDYFRLDNHCRCGEFNSNNDNVTFFVDVGILLGRFIDGDSRHIIFDTFVTKDMARDYQIDSAQTIERLGFATTELPLGA